MLADKECNHSDHKLHAENIIRHHSITELRYRSCGVALRVKSRKPISFVGGEGSVHAYVCTFCQYHYKCEFLPCLCFWTFMQLYAMSKFLTNLNIMKFCGTDFQTQTIYVNTSMFADIVMKFQKGRKACWHSCWHLVLFGMWSLSRSYIG